MCCLLCAVCGCCLLNEVCCMVHARSPCVCSVQCAVCSVQCASAGCVCTVCGGVGCWVYVQGVRPIRGIPLAPNPSCCSLFASCGCLCVRCGWRSVCMWCARMCCMCGAGMCSCLGCWRRPRRGRCIQLLHAPSFPPPPQARLIPLVCAAPLLPVNVRTVSVRACVSVCVWCGECSGWGWCVCSIGGTTTTSSRDLHCRHHHGDPGTGGPWESD